MPRVNLSSVGESTGEFKQLENGGYVVTITAVRSDPANQRIFIDLDIAEGPCAGFYRHSQYPLDDVMSYKETALGMLKHKLHVLADANPGRLHAYADNKGKFAGISEFDNDQFDAFVGCVFGAVVRTRLYTNGRGEDRSAPEVGAWKSPDDIRAGKWTQMEPRDTRTGAKAKPAPAAPTKAAYDSSAADVYDEDVPF